MTRIAIIPYRKIGFARVFGFTVRDLMILRILDALPDVERIDWFERPGLPHEYARDLVRGTPNPGAKVRCHSGLDLGLIGALKHRRVWTHHAMTRHENGLASWADEAGMDGIVLDFNPFYVPPVELISRATYWYDLIDTFTKHNRFSEAEKTAVARKYDFVKEHADLVTGVTPAAVAPFGGTVLANRLLRESIGEAGTNPEYDLGFLGFITDKFDIKAVRDFAAQGLKILICGHAYDPAVAKKLESIENVTYHGAFTSTDVPGLISKFRVGMVPYRPDMSHDESPIKFFQYLAYGRPAILSSHFNEIEGMFPQAVCYFKQGQTADAVSFVKGWSENFSERSRTLQGKARNTPDLFWDRAISGLLSQIG
ncbi:glycosyltransferase [Pacificibacter marinus]|uniref:Teichuronic acid biosynthesis glycosyltransferase TuaH n=1 Tax=Pacificibacter marinus TaxID=658057 RepID=A0A1Y5TTW2_9RHOB|nr:glycosyltransferase [Pacificibacter marinus]SEL42566.1 hypothetical protein SAMN04488032_1306 [Pacificibacter marinus]SLN70064.1 hypothetical protein PAM7971_03744 [Pacificibacter marinus]